MDVESRVGSHKLDSSNFVSDEGFRGFIGPTGSVGIDRDYDSLRQDLWIATDQAFKEAVDTYSRKRSEEHTSELQSRLHLVCRLLLEKKKKNNKRDTHSSETLR